MLARLCRASPVQVSVGRWYLSVGTKHWHNYVSLGGIEFLGIVVGHFQLCSGFNWKPHWPRIYDWRIFQHVLGPENKRWTDHAVGIHFWPISFGVYWHTTCYGCAAEYSRDLTAHDERRRAAAKEAVWPTMGRGPVGQ